ncbi:hypothetical protein [Thermococcus sp. MV11]|uniref:hypothetical protein n=1 Tax=Thermococcus sp. MV11 TaxID=1638267 RepID=UPI001F106FD9|nr:hypothetical protein [Thermococcus sp. MV11]
MNHVKSAVVSVRVPPELKREMEKYDINWSEEIRGLHTQKDRGRRKRGRSRR